MERHDYFNLGGSTAMDPQARDDMMREINSTVKVCVGAGVCDGVGWWLLECVC